MRELGKQVPDLISDSDLEYYTSLTSKRGKKKFLSFLCKREALRKREKMKRLEKQSERKNEKEDDIDGTLPVNRLMRRVSDVTILTGDNWRLAAAMKFGPQIAFDFSYDALMERPEIVSMVSQLNHVLNANKQARNPFYMHWTGLKDGSKSLKEMRRMFGDTFENLMVNVTDKDVLDIFPKDELIFLTADSTNIMHTFDIDKIYVIGGLVDSRTIQTGVTLAKAKRYNISHARFPLDLYLQWELGAKTLTLDQVARILHSMNESHDWMEALKNVPTRKHGGFKVSRNVSPQAFEMISSRPDLEKYYNKTKESIERKKGRKEGMIRDSGRFSFSRAKREFKWDLLESDDAEKFSENSKEWNTSVWMNEEENNDFDPTGDTLFSSSEKVVGKVENSKNRGKSKRTKWYH
ncbi:tRNA methyltransferase 10-like C [Holothuria leucospilota]|uniref:RNA (guanine-9-)-methyltransferase domain-containing protein 1 n=1 Tax=Holothuria leucospilota TaxID=206669 RepID=A0A9Q1CN07_HOLLE|nr:tRNA methyltransferase 10-like C [Holothuria leucospilota]